MLPDQSSTGIFYTQDFKCVYMTFTHSDGRVEQLGMFSIAELKLFGIDYSIEAEKQKKLRGITS